MPKTMACFVMHGVNEVGMMDKPIPTAGPNDAVIRTTAALICTSDGHTVAGALGPREDVALGHEAVGVIHELGEAVAATGRFRIGQRVAINAVTPCFGCHNCQRGSPASAGGCSGGTGSRTSRTGTWPSTSTSTTRPRTWRRSRTD